MSKISNEWKACLKSVSDKTMVTAFKGIHEILSQYNYTPERILSLFGLPTETKELVAWLLDTEDDYDWGMNGHMTTGAFKLSEAKKDILTTLMPDDLILAMPLPEAIWYYDLEGGATMDKPQTLGHMVQIVKVGVFRIALITVLEQHRQIFFVS